MSDSITIANKEKPSSLKSVIIKNLVPIIIAIILFAVAFFLRTWRISSSPDIFSDEILYADIAIKLPKYGFLMAYGLPWFVHPPLYFLLQSAYFQLAGIGSVTLSNVFSARLTSALFSSLTILFVFFFITKISDYRIGTFSALVLMFEPYALKYARIGILDSALVLFIIVSFYIFTEANNTKDVKKFVLSGVLFGLALITKELALSLLVILAVWYLLTRFVTRNNISTKGILIFLANGFLIYLIYVAWALSIDAQIFIATNLSLMERSLWIVSNTGYTSPNNISFLSDFLSTTSIYLVSYLILALALVSCFYLLYKNKNKTEVFLTSWFIGSVIFFAAMGIHNPQFFVYLTVPASVVTGFTLSKIGLRIPQRKKIISYGALLLLFLIIFYNLGVWMVVDNGTDNSVSQSVAWVQGNIPKGQTIYVDNSDFSYLLSNYNIKVSDSNTSKNTLDSIKGQNIHYFIFTTKLKYELNLDLLTFVQTKGTIIASFSGRSLGQTDIYYVPNANHA